MKVLIHAVVPSLNEQDVKAVQALLEGFDPDLSFSPSREAPGLNDCLEFWATGQVSEEQKRNMLEKIDDDWDTDDKEQVFWAYAFNTKMISDLIYYIQLDFS